MWKDGYKIGIDKIDEQHKELFLRVTDFLFSLRKEGNSEDKLAKVKETLEFMQSYVVIHFDTEEAYQKEINYPELLAHKEIHNQFKQEVSTFTEQFNVKNYDEVQAQKFASMLLAWLIKHVIIYDRKIADFVREHEV